MGGVTFQKPLFSEDAVKGLEARVRFPDAFWENLGANMFVTNADEWDMLYVPKAIQGLRIIRSFHLEANDSGGWHTNNGWHSRAVGDTTLEVLRALEDHPGIRLLVVRTGTDLPRVTVEEGADDPAYKLVFA